MDVARHVIDTYFRDTFNPMVRHHLDSFNDFLQVKLPLFLKASNPMEIKVDGNRIVRIYLGSKTGDEIRYLPPKDEFGNAIFPHMCRLENKTYAIAIEAKIDIEYTFGDGSTEMVHLDYKPIGSIPLMLKSPMCFLAPLSSDDLFKVGECRFELGGYFVITGKEKCLLTQERLGDNMFYAKKRHRPADDSTGLRSVVQTETASKLEGATKEDDYEYICGVRSVSEDGTVGPYGHMLFIPPKNKVVSDPKVIAKQPDYGEFSTKRLATIQLPNFLQPVPLFSVFHALGFYSDQDIYDTILLGLTPTEKTQYDILFLELLFSHETFVKQEMARDENKEERDSDLLFLKRQTRTRTHGTVYVNLYKYLFPHCEHQEKESIASLYRRKGYLLGHMVKMAMDVELGIKENTDRDHYIYKRLIASGDLCFQLFTKIYNQLRKDMLTRLDARVHFRQKIYEGKNITTLILNETIERDWKPYLVLSEFEKAFKKQWQGKDGVSQELIRSSYLATISMLRRVNVDMDRDTKQVPARRLHSSSWGFMCPSDNPDGSSVGLVKSMTLFSRISTQVPRRLVYEIIKNFKEFLPIVAIHPSAWQVGWTKLFLNSDLIGAIKADTESLHEILVEKRRSQEIPMFVSFLWNRIENVYTVCTDAGRIVRPLYREGITEDEVFKLKKWENIITKTVDYIDAQESDGTRVSMTPFHKTYPSEIHGSTIFSASGSVIPYIEHNQGPRNMFSCQQTKHACSWFNTAFHKRFDVIAALLRTPQRPISQTWTTPHILGGNACMPYGENAIVAIACFSGYNQDDSILLNDSSIRRGMFQISYYHSYDVAEELIDPAIQSHTTFGNLVENPKYRESVTLRNKDANYDLLDGDGIITLGAHVTENTVLVGIVTPILNNSGQVEAYRDVSYLPKKGQHGRIDAVHRYKTAEGLQGVKIRISESREPMLGDKLGSRHGQKGTCGERIPEHDMPYTKDGLRPDIIVNPHAFPSRMTIGQFIESMSAKVGLGLGCLVDGTSFSTQNRVQTVQESLTQMGYHPYGHELMYNGMTGEMMETEIFMGPTYYKRLKQMTEDKINYRTTGPRTMLTKQPVEGRANGGGLRIGEMERDSLLSHGISNFIQESLMKRSDAYEFLFQPDTGLLDANVDLPVSTLQMPYSMGLLVHELESSHISMKLIGE